MTPMTVPESPAVTRDALESPTEAKGPADPGGSTGPVASSECQPAAFGVWTRTTITPSSVTLSTFTVVPVFGGFTLIQPGLYVPGWSAAPCLSRACHQVWVSSNVGTAL